MKILSRMLITGAVSALALGTISSANAADQPYKHVLLISVDGMHAIDLANYMVANPNSTLASLVHTGVVYPNALTAMPSDSFPGFLAQVTGGTPKSTGVFYDDSFDRTYFAPDSNCAGAPGAEVSFAENIDVDDKQLNAGGTPGDWKTQIDLKKLPMALVDGKCTAMYPHTFARVNNVFEIVKSHGGYTAWSDKHPAYEWLAGPSGKGLDDLFALEQDSLSPAPRSRRPVASRPSGISTRRASRPSSMK